MYWNILGLFERIINVVETDQNSAESRTSLYSVHVKLQPLPAHQKVDTEMLRYGVLVTKTACS